MLKYIGVEKQTFVRARKKSINLYVKPGDIIDDTKLTPDIIEALLETGQFLKLRKTKIKNRQEDDIGGNS